MAEKIIDRSTKTMYEEDQCKYATVINRKRALPDVRDGLKPVQRRVIYGAYKEGLTKPSKKDKSASLVGYIMKTLHPHGDCVHKDLRVYLLNGTATTIGDLYESGVQAVEIMAVNPYTGKVVPAVAHSFRIGQYTNLKYHIRLSNGAELVCTSNHPIMLPNGTFIKAENVKPYSRVMLKTVRFHSSGRPMIDNHYVQNIITDYYYAEIPKGYDRHHKDNNYYNNCISNIDILTHSDHIALHGHDNSSIMALEHGRENMFNEYGKYRQKIVRKNSTLAKAMNQHQSMIKFKAAIRKLQESGIPVTYENYEALRPTTYNLPKVENLLKKYPENKTFEDLVNCDPISISDMYKEKMSKVIVPLDYIPSMKPERVVDWYTGRSVIYKVFDRIIDSNLPLTVESYYQCAITERNIDPDRINALLQLYPIECPYVVDVYTEKVDNEPMYDFTVDGYENMLIPMDTPDNLSGLNGTVGMHIPMISIHNSSIYEAVVTLTNWFKTKMPLFYGKGNWGNLLGSGAAAMRYTECALSDFGYETFIEELQQANNIVDWNPTYKRNGDMEPEYLPNKLPLLLINGSFGIGVGMSISIPSYNLVEVIDVTRKLLKDPNADFVLIPDLCQPCNIIDTDWRSICEAGNGSFKVRGIITEETDKKGNVTLHIRSLPDSVSTTSVYEKILKMVEDKQMPMIKDIFNALDDKELPDIIINLKPGADPAYVKQVIYAKTDVQKTISVNFEAVDINGIDTKRFSYREYLLKFIDQAMNIKFRLYCNKLQQVMTRHYQVDAFVKVLESGEIDNIINLIRKNKTTDDSVIIEQMIKKCKITDIQAKFIIGVNLSRLSAGHLSKYREERKELEAKIKQYQAAVSDDGSIIRAEIDNDLAAMAAKYGTPRLCTVKSIKDENDIPKGIFKIVITERNYIRKIPDVDKVGIVKKDNPKFILKVDNAENILLFDNKGKVFKVPVSKIPITDRSSQGIDIRILIKNLTSDIISVFYEPIFHNISKSGNKHYLTVLTKSNVVKKLDIEDFLNVTPSGLMYSKIGQDDEVVGIGLVPHNLDIAICSGNKALRTSLTNVPLLKRNAMGNKAMDTDKPITGMSVIYPDTTDVVVITKNGRFNRYSINLFNSHNRATKGSSVIKEVAGDEIFNIFAVNETDKIRVLTSEGVEEVPVANIKVKSNIAAGEKMLSAKSVIVRADVVR